MHGFPPPYSPALPSRPAPAFPTTPSAHGRPDRGRMPRQGSPGRRLPSPLASCPRFPLRCGQPMGWRRTWRLALRHGAKRLPAHRRATPRGRGERPSPPPTSYLGLVASRGLLPVPSHGRRIGGVEGSACPAAASCALTGGRLHAPALHGAACAIQRRGLASQGKVPAGRWCGRAAFSEVSQGGECGCRGRSRRAVGGLRHQGRVPEAANLPPRKARAGRPRRAGGTAPPHRVSNAMGRPSRLRNGSPGPPPSREPSCSTAGGASSATGPCTPPASPRTWRWPVLPCRRPQPYARAGSRHALPHAVSKS